MKLGRIDTFVDVYNKEVLPNEVNEILDRGPLGAFGVVA